MRRLCAAQHGAGDMLLCAVQQDRGSELGITNYFNSLQTRRQ
jgi:hypothetical protein